MFFKSPDSIKFLLSLLVSAGLLLWIALTVSWQEVGRELAEVHYWVFIPASVVIIAHFLLRSWRWKFLLGSSRELTIKKLFDAIMIGNFASYILPLRAGEFIRPFMLARQTSHSFSSCFVSVVIERFFDLCLVLITFVLLVLFFDGMPAWAHTGALVLSFVALGILVFILAAAFSPGLLQRILDPFLNRLPEKLEKTVKDFVLDFLDGALVLKNPLNLARIIGLTLLVWFSCYFLFYVFLFLVDTETTLFIGTTIAVVVALAVAAPSAPGFVGVYQTACIGAFALFGLDSETAVAYSLVTHFYQYVIFIGYGIYILLSQNLSLKDMQLARARAVKAG